MTISAKALKESDITFSAGPAKSSMLITKATWNTFPNLQRCPSQLLRKHLRGKSNVVIKEGSLNSRGLEISNRGHSGDVHTSFVLFTCIHPFTREGRKLVLTVNHGVAFSATNTPPVPSAGKVGKPVRYPGVPTCPVLSRLCPGGARMLKLIFLHGQSNQLPVSVCPSHSQWEASLQLTMAGGRKTHEAESTVEAQTLNLHLTTLLHNTLCNWGNNALGSVLALLF